MVVVVGVGVVGVGGGGDRHALRLPGGLCYGTRCGAKERTNWWSHFCDLIVVVARDKFRGD